MTVVVVACVCWGSDTAITASLDSYTPVALTFAKGLVAGTAHLALGLALEPRPSLATVLWCLRSDRLDTAYEVVGATQRRDATTDEKVNAKGVLGNLKAGK